ncbi:hypothetical protein EPI10_005895 [Gossypium australe]|uniref:Uncharacterized protein n=1 Tax=Gossypium australe TaxID=47621 RepID=A0A5B6WPD5_9ROSI|nr:hypothetical protein EPI10_005895 [Gossypium australe]
MTINQFPKVKKLQLCTSFQHKRQSIIIRGHAFVQHVAVKLEGFKGFTFEKESFDEGVADTNGGVLNVCEEVPGIGKTPVIGLEDLEFDARQDRTVFPSSLF